MKSFKGLFRGEFKLLLTSNTEILSGKEVKQNLGGSRFSIRDLDRLRFLFACIHRTTVLY